MSLDVERLNRDFGRIVQDVLSRLTDLDGADVQVTVEVVANKNDGFPDSVINIVVANARMVSLL